MAEYITLNKGKRLLSYVIDVGCLIAIGYLLFPFINRIGPQDIVKQIHAVHASIDVIDIQNETIVLIGLIEQFTISLAIMGCIYEVACYSSFRQTIGKALCGLELQEDHFYHTNIYMRILIRSVIKAVMFAFLGGVLLVFSGFSIIASPIDLSIQDRIGKTRIVKKVS